MHYAGLLVCRAAGMHYAGLLVCRAGWYAGLAVCGDEECERRYRGTEPVMQPWLLAAWAWP